jgi:hypothetical protein
MKSIGVNQWAGADPWLADIVSNLQRQAARAKKADEDRWSRMVPSEKFFAWQKIGFRIPGYSASPQQRVSGK